MDRDYDGPRMQWAQNAAIHQWATMSRELKYNNNDKDENNTTIMVVYGAICYYILGTDTSINVTTKLQVHKLWLFLNCANSD